MLFQGLKPILMNVEKYYIWFYVQTICRQKLLCAACGWIWLQIRCCCYE